MEASERGGGGRREGLKGRRRKGRDQVGETWRQFALADLAWPLLLVTELRAARRFEEHGAWGTGSSREGAGIGWHRSRQRQGHYLLRINPRCMGVARRQPAGQSSDRGRRLSQKHTQLASPLALTPAALWAAAALPLPACLSGEWVRPARAANAGLRAGDELAPGAGLAAGAGWCWSRCRAPETLRRRLFWTHAVAWLPAFFLASPCAWAAWAGAVIEQASP